MSLNKLVIVKEEGEKYDWPKDVRDKFDELCEVADNSGIALICAVGFPKDPVELQLGVHFSARSSSNPNLSLMCSDIADLFQMMSGRLKQ